LDIPGSDRCSSPLRSSGGQVHARGVGARLQLERAAVLDDGLGQIARFVAITTEVVVRVEIFRVSVDRPAQQFAGAGKPGGAAPIKRLH
jgi:hypothetical protein